MACSCGGGDQATGEMSVQSLGKIGKDFCPNFLENVDRSSCNDGGRVLIPLFHNPHLPLDIPWLLLMTNNRSLYALITLFSGFTFMARLQIERAGFSGVCINLLLTIFQYLCISSYFLIQCHPFFAFSFSDSQELAPSA